MYSSEMVTSELEYFSGWKRDDPKGFTVGYVLRKLPARINTGDGRGTFQLFMMHEGSRGYSFGYAKPEFGKFSVTSNDTNTGYLLDECTADTPENAICALASGLFIQDILKLKKSESIKLSPSHSSIETAR